MDIKDYFIGLIGLVIVGIFFGFAMRYSVEQTLEEMSTLQDANQELLLELEEAKATIYFQQCQTDPDCMMPELTFEEVQQDAEFPPVPEFANE